MPILALFTVCEKVIIEDNGMPSLITLFTRIATTPNIGAEIPSNALAPKEWAIFTAWDWEKDDEGVRYTQAIEVRVPDGKVFADIKTNFVIERDKRQQVRVPLVGFPIGQRGDCTVHLWLRRGSTLVTEAAPVRITVEHLLPASEPS
jgi:hypothetical protein